MISIRHRSLTPSLALSLLFHILLVIAVGMRYQSPDLPRLESYAVDLVYRVPSLQVESPRYDGTENEEPLSNKVQRGIAEQQSIISEEVEDSISETVNQAPLVPGAMETIVSSAGDVSNRVLDYDYGELLKGLRTRIASSLVYPRAARRRGIEGEVVLLLKLAEDGSLANLSVRSSSGSDILDRAARELIKRILPYRHGAGRTISVEIPIVYRLEKG
jgi:TonB family protein